MSTNNFKTVGQVLYEVRNEKGLSRAKLLETSALGDICTERTLARIESGETEEPNPRVLYALRTALGLSWEDLESRQYGIDMRTFNEHVEKIRDTFFYQKYDRLPALIAELRAKNYYNEGIPIMKQAVLSLEAIALHRCDKDYTKSIEVVLEALRLTSPTLIDEAGHVYNEKIEQRTLTANEYRLLVALNSSRNMIGEHNYSIDTYYAMAISLESEVAYYSLQKSLLATVYSNLSHALYNARRYLETMGVVDKGILFCKEHREFKLLGTLICRKGFVLCEQEAMEKGIKYLTQGCELLAAKGVEHSAERYAKYVSENYGVTISYNIT